MGIYTAEIADGIYWVGGNGQDGGLHCNPYLLVDGEEAVLIDPGSVLDFEYVFKNVCSIIPLEKIKYVILHHQDPDFCASVPLFEQKGANFKIVTHWRTQVLVKYYGVKSDYYIINKNESKLVLKSGRTIEFVPTPYLHFPGAIATYDPKSKTLFSSDLFGAFSYQWSLYAGENYIEKMKTFHEHYMPSNEIIRPVMEVFLGMDILRIAPQHGSVIKDNIQEHIKVLRDLECGSFLNPIKKNLAKSGGYKSIYSKVLKRYSSIFNKDEVLEVLQGLDITLEKETMEITDYNYRGVVLWDLLFECVLAKKGIQWILVIEPLVQKLCKEYDIPIPEVFGTTLKKVEEEAVTLNKENLALKEINLRLNNSVNEALDKLTRCPVTGLYNYGFFKSYLATEIKAIVMEGSEQNPALIVISLDNMAKISFSYGSNEVDEILKNIGYTINNEKEENVAVFRLQGTAFACYIPHTTKELAVMFAETLRNLVRSSEKFIEKITASIGVLSFDEIREKNSLNDELSEVMYNTTIMRVRLAKNKGMNIVCSNSEMGDYQEEIGKILIVDTDKVNIDVLKTFLENLKYKVFTANDGEEALAICEKEEMNFIISEVMIPKIDGFLVREKLLMQSKTKNIPFVIVSHLKNDDSVKRAIGLGVEHYFKKPFMLSELLGVIKNIIKGDAYQ